MNLKLQSDFVDYYDPFFNRQGSWVYERIASPTEGQTRISRQEAFQLLHSWGLAVPEHGHVKELASRLLRGCQFMTDYTDSAQVVVYLDPYAHRGEGKVLMTAEEALAQYPDAYCSEYVHQQGSAFPSISWRLLQIGPRRWWMKYTSEFDWRSNVGEGKVEIVKELKPRWNPFINLPMYAVDFLPTNPMLAVDFNSAPGLTGTGIQEILSGPQVVGLIKEYYGKNL